MTKKTRSLAGSYTQQSRGHRKKKRKTSPTTPELATSTPNLPQRVESSPVTSVAQEPRPQATSRVTARSSFAEHRYVLKEVRRIGIIGGILIALIVVLAMILPRIYP